MPFASYWDGAPVHGSIDLVYESGGRWNLIDFKTDDISGRPLPEAAGPYLSQLALYASALEMATGQRPAASLLFLGAGEAHTPSAEDLEQALASARARIETGQALETSPSAELEDEPTQMTDLS